MSRREFLKTSGVIAAATTLNGFATNAALASRALVDVNVSLGYWPFRRLPLDETKSLVAKLRANGVTQAWAGNFDSLLHRDLAAANAWLAAECRRHGHGLLFPFGSVNPALAGWEEDLRRCQEQHRMSGIRLYPNYHGYKLDDPQFAKLLTLAHSRHLIVQIALSMEDERTQNSAAQVPHVDVKPLLEVQRAPRLVLLNWSRAIKLDLLGLLAERGVCFDMATVEGVGGIANLLRDVSAHQIVFGSHAPFFYFESAVLKLQESALAKEEERAIRSDNARRLLNR
jgi:predicted TIM-barrel fold metal-dependent hydrolase